MILQALADYYHRKSAQDGSPIAPPGWETKEIPYVVVISRSGSAIQVESTVEGEGRTKRAKVQLIPAAVKRSVNIKANLLWDNVEYALGVPTGKSRVPGNKEKVHKKVVARHQAFTERVKELAERACDEGLDALSKFLETYDGSQIGEERDWQEFLEKGPFLSFRLKGDQVLIPQRPKVRAFIDDAPVAPASAVCLVPANLIRSRNFTHRSRACVGRSPLAQTSFRSTSTLFNLSVRSKERMLPSDRGQRSPMPPRSIICWARTQNRRYKSETPPQCFGRRSLLVPLWNMRLPDGLIHRKMILTMPPRG